MPDQPRPAPAHWAVVHPARHLPVVSGANLGDPVAGDGLCEPGDVYRLVPDAAGRRLRLGFGEGGGRVVAEGSELGRPGEAILPLSHFTFMGTDGEQVEAILLAIGATGEEVLLPLSPLSPRTDYTLLAARAADGSLPLTDLICISFAAGTRITLPDGRQERIEALAVGDRVLTRDHGPQEIRWIGRATLRAKGAFAPVEVRSGVLGNGSKLIVSPHHRLFLYQRGTPRVGGTAEILVQAKHLVDDKTILRREGGFVDYLSLVFDRHEIVYAEGIAAESLMVNAATVQHLPPELSEDLLRRFPRLSQTQHFGTEIGRDAVAGLGGIGPTAPEEG